MVLEHLLWNLWFFKDDLISPNYAWTLIMKFRDDLISPNYAWTLIMKFRNFFSAASMKSYIKKNVSIKLTFKSQIWMRKIILFWLCSMKKKFMMFICNGYFELYVLNLDKDFKFIFFCTI